MGKKAVLVVILAFIFPGVLLGQGLPRPHLWIGPRGGVAMYSNEGDSENRPIFGGEIVLMLPVIPLDFQLSGDFFSTSESGGDSQGLVVDLSAKYNLLPLPAVPLFAPTIQLGIGGGIQNLSGDVRPAGEDEGTYGDFHVFLGLGLRLAKVGLFVEPKYSRVFTENGINSFSGTAGLIYQLF